MAESRVEDLLETGVEQPVLPMSEIEAILRGEPVTPHSRIAELLLKYNPSDILIEKRITENGTYFATNDNADGYYKVVVDEYVPRLIFKEVTANGTYDPAVDGADGYSSIRVNLPLEHQIGEVFNQNGLYHVTPSQGYEGISRADIMVQVNPVLETKTIDANGTYTPSQGYDGFSEVTVDVPGQNADLALRCVGLDGYSVTITSADNSETYTKSVTGSPATITFDNLVYVGNWTVTNTKDSTAATVSNAVSNEDYKLYTQQIPRMTAYDQPSGVISASSEYDDRFLAWFAAANNGGSGGNGWMGASMNSYLIYQFAAPVIFSKLYFRIADVWGFNYYNIQEYGNDIDVLGSVDGTTYERCTSTGSTVNKKGYGDVNIDLNGKKYKYLKVIVPKATFSRDYYNCGVMNLMLYSDPEATAYILGPKSITANGTYNPASDGLDAFSEVTVNVPKGTNANIRIRCLGVDGGTVTITATDGSTTYTHTASVTLTDETVIFNNLEYAGTWTVSNSKDAATAIVDNTYIEGNITLMATKIPQMTSASTPYGECISSSNNWGESRYVWYPFDGYDGPIDNSTSEAWSNQRGDGSPWIGYHFMDSQGNPIKVKMDKVWVQGFCVLWSNSTTRTLYFEGSNDGTNWEKIGLDKIFDFGINTRQSFEHELNGGKYEYFRIRFDSSLNVVDSRWIFIERIQVYASDFAPLPTGALTATENGTYDPEDYDLSAFDEVTVNVPLPENAYLLKDIPSTPTAIATFSDGAEMVMPSLKTTIVPIQSGSGDPSPTNIRPISGWSAVDVNVVGKNFLDLSNYIIGSASNYDKSVGSTLSSGGSGATVSGATNPLTITNNTNWRGATFISKLIKANTLYTVSWKTSATTIENVKQTIYLLDENNVVLAKANVTSGGEYARTATTTQDCFVALTIESITQQAVVLSDLQIELGSTPTTYEPYNGQTYTIDLDGTRYGGTLDVVSGVLTVDRVGVDLGDLNWTYGNGFFRTTDLNATIKKAASNFTKANVISSIYTVETWNAITNTDNGKLALSAGTADPLLICNTDYTDATAFKQAMNGVQLVYELVTPLTIQLTPTAVKSLEGVNNLFADSGEILEGEYLANPN